jgi:hypothetical protein
MPRYLIQHSNNDRAIAFEDIPPNPLRLVIKGQTATLTDTLHSLYGINLYLLI